MATPKNAVATPARQKKRNIVPERREFVRDEVKSLFKAGIIQEVQCPEWLANVALVNKENGD